MKESVGLLPQNNTVYCSCQRGQRRGKQGAAPGDTREGNANQGGGKESGGKTRERTVGLQTGRQC